MIRYLLDTNICGIWLILILSIGGCSGPVDNTTLFMGISTAPVQLDPRRATDAVSNRINRLLYSRLVEFDPTNRPIPGLADWTVVTPLQYRFHLKDDLKHRRFSNGHILNAEDVRATFASILEPATASPYRSQIALIKRMQTFGQDDIEFYLTKADPLFPTRLVLEILPADLIAADHKFQNQPVGSGAFDLLAWPQPGRLQLVRRTDGQALEFLEVKDPSVRVMKLLRGEINILQNDLPPELFRLLRGRPEVTVMQRPGINFTYLGLNMQYQGLMKLSVRRAIAHAIDRKAIVRYLLDGGGRLAQSLLTPNHWAGAPDLAPMTYDQNLARQLLAQSGYGPDHPLELTYKTSTDPFRVRLATVIQAQLKAVNINVQVQSLDWGTFYGDIKEGRFQLYSLSWVAVKTPDHFRSIVHSTSAPPSGYNRGHYSNLQVDTLLNQAAELPDLKGQAEVYRTLQHVLYADLPYIPLWYEDQIAVVSQGVQNYAPADDGNFDALIQAHR